MGQRFVFIVIIAFLITTSGIAAGDSGSDIYGARCASCHGVDSAGKTNAAKTFNGMPDLRVTVPTKTDEQLFETIARGTDHKKYPHAFLQTGLTPAQVKDIVGHLRKLAKK